MRIFCLIMCLVFILLSCYSAFFSFDKLVMYARAFQATIDADLEWQAEDFKEKTFNYSILFLADIGSFAFLVACFIGLSKKTNFSNSLRYTYEEYKALREEKKAEKQRKKKEKLQKQLEKIEKAE